MTDESKTLKIVRNVAVGEGAIGLNSLLGEHQPDIVNRHLGLLMSTMNWSIRPTDPVTAINELDLRMNVYESQSSEKMADTVKLGVLLKGLVPLPEVQKHVMKDSAKIRSHFASRAISCSNVHGVLPVHERFWFCLVQVSTTQFCGFPPVLMARPSDGTDVLVSPLLVSSLNVGSPNGSLPELTHIEQMVSSLAARVTALETNATSVSSGSSSARSWNILGHCDGSTATGSLGSHGPGSSDDNRNTRRRLDTFSSPEVEQARSAVLLRFPCEQYHQGITIWVNGLWEKSNMPAHNKPVRIHCKAGSVSARLVFETRAKCQDFVARYKDDGTCSINSPFCSVTNTNIAVRQSKSM